MGSRLEVRKDRLKEARQLLISILARRVAEEVKRKEQHGD